MLSTKKSETNAWKKLITQLPSVINAELRTNSSGAVTELHVLADTERSPKQIVRDIQSAVMAKYGAELDHRVISVAQIPNEVKVAAAIARIRLSGLEMTYRPSGCGICVKLENGDKIYSGSGSSDNVCLNRYRVICGATVDALNEILADRALLAVQEVRFSELGGKALVMVCLSLRVSGRTDTLVGVCTEDDTGGLAAVKATLDAVNRRLGMLL